MVGRPISNEVEEISFLAFVSEADSVVIRRRLIKRIIEEWG